MTSLSVDDLAVVTGPLVFLGGHSADVDLITGEVVKILESVDEDGDVYVYGYESHQHQYVSESSLTPLSDLGTEDGQIIWDNGEPGTTRSDNNWFTELLEAK